MRKLSIFLIALSLAFSLSVPSGCVTGPDGKRQLDPNFKTVVSNVAKTAAMIGLAKATAGISELAPYAPALAKTISSIFDNNDDPKEIGNQLKDALTDVALQIGNQELQELLFDYMAAELVSQTPAAGPGGAEQYQFNQAIVDSFE